MTGFWACVNPRNLPHPVQFWSPLFPRSAMDPSPRLDALVAPLRADVVSGAAVVARMACEVMRRAAGRIEAGTPEEVRAGLAQVGLLVLDAQPAMAPLVALVRDILDAVEGAADAAGARDAARSAADAFRAGLETRAQVVAARAAAVLPSEGAILTLSSSSTVRGALLHGAGRRTGRVVVLESRPMQEGHLLAAALGKAGIPVTVAVDAAVATLVPRCAMVLLGADSVGDLGVVNKVGSLAAAEAARRAAIIAAFLLAAALLVGGAGACWGAQIGGRHRDEGTDFSRWLPRR